MIFKALDGSTFSLEILGYEFPENNCDIYSLNWLMLRVVAKDAEQVVVWDTVEQYMDTYGAYYLHIWLTQIANRNLIPLHIQTGWIDELYFDVIEITESVSLSIKCRYCRFIDGHLVTIRSHFNYEIDLQDFKAAVEQWQSDIEKFPTRVNLYGTTLFL